jgi:hypothetical protein
MSKLFLLLMLATALVLMGCETNRGSREYIPGRGWVPR